MTKQFDIVDFRVEEGVDLGSKLKYFLLPNMVLHLPMKIKCNVNIGCVMSLSGHM